MQQKPTSGRLQVGEFVIDLQTREVMRPGARRGKRLPSKPLEVLLVLASDPGKVCSRDELMDAVWPESFPTADVVTQAIVQIRRAFGDSGDRQDFLETISKSGYRLLAPVRWLPAERREDSLHAETDTPTSALGELPFGRRLSSRGLLAWAGLAALAITAALWWQVPRSPAGGETEARFLRLTSKPGFEVFPDIAPDAKHVVFSVTQEATRSSSLALLNLAATEPVTLTTPEPQTRDLDPVWSRDGSVIAFRRAEPSGSCSLWSILPFTREAKKIGVCPDLTFGLEWTPDGQRLLLGGRDLDSPESGGRIHAFDLASRTLQPFEYERKPEDWDSTPRISPDGRWLAFRRGVNAADIWLVSMSGGKPRRLTEVAGDVRGLDWSADGDSILFGLVDHRGTSLQRVEVATGKLERLALGTATNPSVARQSDVLVVQVVAEQHQIGTLDGLSGAWQPEARLASTGRDELPSISPDGRWVAFYSDRRQATELWIAGLEEGSGMHPVSGLVPLPRFGVSWSDDARSLLVIGMQADQRKVFRIERESLLASALPIEAANPTHALFLGRDTVAVIRPQRNASVLETFDIESGSRRGAASIEDVGFAMYDAPRDRILFSRESRRGLFAAPTDLSGEVLVTAELPTPDFYKGWALDADALWVLRRKIPDAIALWRMELGVDSAEPSWVADVDGALLPALSAHGVEHLWATRRTSSGADLWVLHSAPATEAAAQP